MSLACAWPNLAVAAPAADAPELTEPPTEVPEPTTAGEWYAHGIELANAEDFASAAAAFVRSYELQPTSDALFNAALAYENAGATIDAIHSYERFLAEPERKEEYVPAAERSIEALTQEIGVLKGVRYEAEHPPTELWVDGRRVELDGFPVLVMPGEIEVEVVDARGDHAREFYEIAAGEALVVDVRALIGVPEPEPNPDPNIVIDDGPSADELEAEQRRARRAARLLGVTWIGLGVAGAGAVTAVTLGVLAQSTREGPFEDETCYEFTDGTCPSDFDIRDPEGKYNRYKSYALGSAIATGVSAGVAAATLVIGLVSLGYARSSKKSRSRASVRVVPTFGGVALEF